MSEKHTTDYSTTEKAESVQSVKARTNPRQANQKHLGLKAFIISASVLGTVAGWGIGQSVEWLGEQYAGSKYGI